MSVLSYLNTVLAQRGPNAVPYDEAVKWNIRDHVTELLEVSR
jgi:ESCRT-I complex subunit TSG101